MLALLLGSGTAGTDAIELAGRLIVNHDGLSRLANAPVGALQQLPGMGPAKAARVAAAFELARRAGLEPERSLITGSGDLAAVAAPLLRGLRHERVVVGACDSGGRVLRIVPLTEGAVDRSLIPLRDVLSTVLTAGGTAFGVAHNHPSGSLQPSEPDVRVTARLRKAAETVGLRFLNHIIVTASGWARIGG